MIIAERLTTFDLFHSIKTVEDQMVKNNKKKVLFYLITGLALLSIICLCLIMVILNKKPQNKKNSPAYSQTRPTNSINSEQETSSPSYPEINVEEWIFQAKKINPFPLSLRTYPINNRHNEQDLYSLAKKLGIDNEIRTEKSNKLTALYTENKKNNKAAMIFFNNDTGSFSYASTEGISQTADSLIKSIYANDASLTLAASYSRRDQPGLKYYEYHRDWQKIGLPVFNAIGILSLPEDRALSSLSLSAKTDDLLPDKNIFQTTDNKDGYTRQTDFNSLTVIKDEQKNSIVGLNSNLKAIDYSKTKTETTISFEEALSRLKTGKYQSLITQPSGQGTPNFEKVYPKNRILAKKAIITDTSLAYLEEPYNGAQSSLMPFYIFKGYADLESGYRVNFIASVKATDTQVLGESTDQITPQGQQQSTVEFPTKTPTPHPSQPSSHPSSSPTVVINKGNCVISDGYEIISTNMLSNIRQIKGLKIGDYSYTELGKTWNNKYYIPEGLLDANSLISALKSAHIFQRSVQDFVRDYLKAVGNQNCAVRASGISPSIFVYDNPHKNITVSVKDTDITYVDPLFQRDKVWLVKTLGQGKLQTTGGVRDFLYYEYSPIKFDQPSTGWIVDKSGVKDFVKGRISSQLRLTEKEVRRTISEIEQAAYHISTDKILVGIIEQKELDKRLPLKISPDMDIYRLHFYVGSADHLDPVNHPRLGAIDRSKPFVFEIGATYQY